MTPTLVLLFLFAYTGDDWGHRKVLSSQGKVNKMTIKDTVIVWGKPCDITVHQRSKTVWIARGEYMGEQLESKGSSQSSAAAHWREAARYKGN
jgi:hypothetical protein